LREKKKKTIPFLSLYPSLGEKGLFFPRVCAFMELGEEEEKEEEEDEYPIVFLFRRERRRRTWIFFFFLQKEESAEVDV